MDEYTKRDEWENAVLFFNVSHDQSAIVNLLRKLHDHDHTEVPDLWFLADLLDGKYALGKRRPPKHKISAGIKQARAANTVALLISDENLTVEKAVAKASEILGMGDSYIKKSYYKSLERKK